MTPKLYEPPKMTVKVQRQSDDTYRLELPNGQSQAINRKQRRAIDAESRRKEQRRHARR